MGQRNPATDQRETRHRQDDEGTGMGMMMVLHLLCCGAPLLLIGLASLGLSAAAFWTAAPYLAGIGVVVGSLVLWRWYRQRECGPDGACALPPVNEGPRRMENATRPTVTSHRRSHTVHQEEL